jgi:hypothetical protein
VPAPGVHRAAPGKYPPHWLVLQLRLNAINDAVRLQITSWGATRDKNAAHAAVTGMKLLIRGTRAKGAFPCIAVHYGGAPGCLVFGVPSSPAPLTAIILSHHGFLYKILAPGPRLSSSQHQMLNSLRFIPRSGRFPPAIPRLPCWLGITSARGGTPTRPAGSPSVGRSAVPPAHRATHLPRRREAPASVPRRHGHAR